MPVNDTPSTEKGMTWCINGQELHFRRPLVMGILNVTPDSFSDGGQFLAPDLALQKALGLISNGADIIDVGGESTRPGSKAIDAKTELSRVIPVITKIAEASDTLISIDTQKAEVAESALNVGAKIINDVSAGRHDQDMFPLVAKRKAGYIMMHMQGQPETMQNRPHYTDLLRQILDFFTDQLSIATSRGIQEDQIVLDPGIGFGKSLSDNLTLIAKIGQLHQLKRPLLLGASRKSFIGGVDGSEPNERLGGSLAAVLYTYLQNVQIYRVHDVLETRQALELFTAIQKHSE